MHTSWNHIALTKQENIGDLRINFEKSLKANNYLNINCFWKMLNACYCFEHPKNT